MTNITSVKSEVTTTVYYMDGQCRGTTLEVTSIRTSTEIIDFTPRRSPRTPGEGRRSDMSNVTTRSLFSFLKRLVSVYEDVSGTQMKWTFRVP